MKTLLLTLAALAAFTQCQPRPSEDDRYNAELEAREIALDLLELGQ